MGDRPESRFDDTPMYVAPRVVVRFIFMLPLETTGRCFESKGVMQRDTIGAVQRKRKEEEKKERESLTNLVCMGIHSYIGCFHENELNDKCGTGSLAVVGSRGKKRHSSSLVLGTCKAFEILSDVVRPKRWHGPPNQRFVARVKLRGGRNGPTYERGLERLRLNGPHLERNDSQKGT
ncbi:hypothetical protein M404DRAFT_9305 [Pisolithus tinctorius Marx 270]|uniref:Uncharacterized protein n=1 Tax=Pisolithus tinctorius Marx 270 TaxID=870435 RepID=A0A0C3P900_PISTI|nr:hypothetical protein M404DRAFT_9305 [Pisolithus tinctorius Marx 270]